MFNTSTWIAKEGARAYTNLSGSGAMPKPFIVKFGNEFWDSITCDAFPAAEPVTIDDLPFETLLLSPDEAAQAIREKVIAILIARNDYDPTAMERRTPPAWKKLAEQIAAQVAAGK